MKRKHYYGYASEIAKRFSSSEDQSSAELKTVWTSFEELQLAVVLENR
jgi:hypothetical protein